MRGLAGLAIVLASGAALAHADPGTDAGAKARTTERYVCDGKATRLGLPAGPFSVSYHRGLSGRDLAGVPVGGRKIFLPTAMSADGEKYADFRFVWWTRGDTAMAYKTEADRSEGTSYCRGVGKSGE